MNSDAKKLSECVGAFAETASEKRKKQKEKVFRKGLLADFSDEITQDWFMADLFDVTHLITCGVAKRPDYVEEGIPFLSAQNARPFKANLNKIRYIDEETFNKITVGGKPERGDVLYTRVGNCGDAAKITYDFDFGIYVSLTLIKPVHGLLDPDYLVAFLNSTYGLVQAGQGAIGIGLKNLNVDNVRRYVIPLPPLAEQKEIALRLDDLLAQVDTLKTRLDGLPAILKRFRQSTLAAATSGKLTEQWREENASGNVGMRLHEYNEERKSEYELSCKRAKEEKRKKPRKPPCLDDKLSLNEEWVALYLRDTPIEWVVKHIAFIGENDANSIVDGPFGASINVKKDYVSSGVPVIRINNIKPFSFSPYEMKFLMREKFNALSRHNVTPGDILFGKVGTIGDACIYPASAEEGILATTGSSRIRVDEHVAVTKFVEIYLNSMKFVFNEIASAAVQPFLNMKTIKSFPIVLPILEEQTEIVRRVEELFAFADQVEQRVQEAQAHVNHLTQSILAKAFRGELTSDWRAANPDLITGENSAKSLLARIKTEREKLKPKKKTRKRGSTA